MHNTDKRDLDYAVDLVDQGMAFPFWKDEEPQKSESLEHQSKSLSHALSKSCSAVDHETSDDIGWHRHRSGAHYGSLGDALDAEAAKCPGTSPGTTWKTGPITYRSPTWPTCSVCKCHTVDGRNPAPVHRWFIPLFTGFLPSQVVQDFFHPQYVQVYVTLMSSNIQKEHILTNLDAIAC